MSQSKCLIVYHSRKGENYVGGSLVNLPVGNTEVAAKMIQAVTGGDLLRIETVEEYPAGYHETTAVAQQELRQSARPRLKTPPQDLDGYETVFLGYPNWWGTAPMAVFTFLEAHDFSGKVVLPFCTHEGSGLGSSEADIRKACLGARVLGGLAIRGGAVTAAEESIRRWIKASGLRF